jgi:monoamine oxidase
MTTSRRDFIKFVVAGSVAAGCPIDHSLLAEAPSADVDGDHFEICHQVRDEHVFSKPPVSKKFDVIVVGGGASGLSAAYFLKQHDFLLLEKEPHWGGNAYLEEYQGQAFATGSAYAEKGYEADHLSKEIGLTLLPVHDADPTIVNGKWLGDPWGSGLDELPYPAAVREGFKKFKADMLAIDPEKDSAHYDSFAMSKILKDYTPELTQWWDAYGPSNWGAKSGDTSALVAIQNMKSQVAGGKDDTRITLPGGNGAITHKLAEVLGAKYSDRMLSGATIVAVDAQKDAVNVTYIRDGKPETVAAKFVIMATPKFITARLVSGIPDAQSDAMTAMRYCPYAVINFIFDKPVYDKGYDTWCPGNTFTDFIVADWVMRSQPGYKSKNNILSFYTPLVEASRSKLLEVSRCKAIAASVLHDFQNLLPEFKDAQPIEIHLYRRGHPMFMPIPGNFTKTIPIVNKPLERVFFANTDSVGPVSDVGGAIRAARMGVDWVEKRMAGAGRASASAVAGLEA